MAATSTKNNGVYSVYEFGDTPFVIICDHASNHIPDELHNLGLPDDILRTHIAWDIGAQSLAQAIARDLGATLFECQISRLVVDVNRAETASDVIPSSSDQIPIPGNQSLNEAEITKRLESFHRPYHHGLDTILSSHPAREDLFIVSIHSFTKRMTGAQNDRPWPIGLLWHHDEASARAAIEILSETIADPIGDNEPYDAREFNYTIDTHVAPKNWRHLTFEVRQDWLATPELVKTATTMLVDAIRAASKNRV